MSDSLDFIERKYGAYQKWSPEDLKEERKLLKSYIETWEQTHPRKCERALTQLWEVEDRLMNEIEERLVKWVRNDPVLRKHLSDVANNAGCDHGPECKGETGCAYEYGDVQLGCLISDYLDTNEPDIGPLVREGADLDAVRRLRSALPADWLTCVEWEKVREGLLAQ